MKKVLKNKIRCKKCKAPLTPATKKAIISEHYCKLGKRSGEKNKKRGLDFKYLGRQGAFKRYGRKQQQELEGIGK